jgi:hypothetical protein
MIPITIQVPDGKEEKYRKILEFLVKEGEFDSMWNGETIIHWNNGKVADILVAPKKKKTFNLTNIR